MKKIISISILFILLLSLFLLPISALDASDPQAEASEALGFTDTLSAFFTENADTLLGVLTLVGSLIVAFLYKTGLLPMLRSGLSALGELMGKSRELTESFTKEAGERFSHMEESLTPMVEAMQNGEKTLASLAERLLLLETALEKSESERRTTSEVLRTETELFYELLSSVNLPEAQKESMTESYYRLKRVLEEAQ